MLASLIVRTVFVGAVLSLPLQTQAQEVPVPVTGRVLQVTLINEQSIEGELIEVSGGSLLMSTSSGYERVNFDAMSGVRARRHGFSNGKVLAWIGIGALVSGAGLTIACSQVAGTNCGAVFPVVGLSWAIVGGLAGSGIARSRWGNLPIVREQLMPYARFPQGAPAGFAPEP